jgi:hypothetical protein
MIFNMQISAIYARMPRIKSGDKVSRLEEVKVFYQGCGRKMKNSEESVLYGK